MEGHEGIFCGGRPVSFYFDFDSEYRTNIRLSELTQLVPRKSEFDFM